MAERRRLDTFFPAQPIEVGRFLLRAGISQAREGDEIEVYLPPAAEHADQIVNQTKPLELTKISTNINEV